jgi:hypothetical protein
LDLGDLLYIARHKKLNLATTLMALDHQLAAEHADPKNGARKLKKKTDKRLRQLGNHFAKSFNKNLRGSADQTAQLRWVLGRPVLHVLTAVELRTKTCCPRITNAIAAQNVRPDLPPAHGAARPQMPAPRPSPRAAATGVPAHGGATLTIGPYTEHSMAHASGFRATFDVSPRIQGVVYQTVHMVYCVGGSKETFYYTEAWPMTAAGKSGKRKRQLTLDQGGDDSFLVPNDAWADDLGTLTITTVAWFEEGKIDSSFTLGEGTELWGRLYGSERKRAEPKDARPIRRLVNATWTQGQRPVWTFFK